MKHLSDYILETSSSKLTIDYNTTFDEFVDFLDRNGFSLNQDVDPDDPKAGLCISEMEYCTGETKYYKTLLLKGNNVNYCKLGFYRSRPNKLSLTTVTLPGKIDNTNRFADAVSAICRYILNGLAKPGKNL